MSDDQNSVSPSYPKFFATVVGTAPDKAITLQPEDLKALCDVFRVATLEDPLATDRPLSVIAGELLAEMSGR